MGAAVVASSSSVLTLNITLYAHRDRITIYPQDGVEENHIPVILAHNSRANKYPWSIDCIDLGAMDDAFLRAGRGIVLKGIFQAIEAHGVRPRDVKGWGQWVNNKTLNQALDSYERTGHVDPMGDYVPRGVKQEECPTCGASCST